MLMSCGHGFNVRVSPVLYHLENPFQYYTRIQGIQILIALIFILFYNSPDKPFYLQFLKVTFCHGIGI